MGDVEAERARALARPDPASWGCITIIGLVLVGPFSWLGGRLGSDAFGSPWVGAIAGALIGFAGYLALALSYRRSELPQRLRAAADVKGGEVQALLVETTRAIELEVDHSSVDPAILIEVDEGQLLLLCGQWLRDPEIYGSNQPPAEDDTPWWNDLAPPHAFPARRFTVTRFPHCGEVLSIEVEGEYLAPERTVGTDLAGLAPRPSEIRKGTLDRVEDALQ